MSIIKYPVATEKSVRMIDTNNTLVFIVDRNATKPQIRKAVEELLGVQVMAVNTHNDVENAKKAYVRLSPATPAIDAATKLGLM
jgi:ribosomal protein L23